LIGVGGEVRWGNFGKTGRGARVRDAGMMRNASCECTALRDACSAALHSLKQHTDEFASTANPCAIRISKALCTRAAR
jgi:hypothetical protein